jgi:peptidoglycan/xylan/chitin deacetylase (PgdA/CDA1 family)
MRPVGEGTSGRTQLVVGVHRDASGGWRRVLDQERIAHRDVVAGDAPVIVFDGVLPPWAEQYVADGGVAVISGALPDQPFLPGGMVVSVTGFVPPGRRYRSVAPGLATVFPASGSGEVRMHEDRVPKYGTDPDAFSAVHFVQHGRGAVVATGLQLTAMLAAPGDRLRRFAVFSQVTERVAAVDKADIVDTLLDMVRHGFRLAGLPLVTLRRFPQGAPSVFLLRVDVDGVFGENAMAVCTEAERQEVAASVYVNGDLSRRHPGRLGPWPERVEVGQHAWTHTLFDGFEDNLANLQRAHAWMSEELGRTPDSFVAPRGLWNPALGGALMAMGYRYSSDFGLDFDSLPFRPGTGELQIPVHPYSPERATVWAAEEGVAPPTAHDVLGHYLQALERQVVRGRPAHLYGHPEILGRMAGTVLPPLVRRARELGLPDMTVGEFADFWIRRESVVPQVLLDVDRQILEVRLTDSEVPVDVSTVGPVELVLNGHRRGRVCQHVTVPTQT